MELVFPLNSNGHGILRGIFKRELTSSLMIIGPSSSCKTSLLMQAAVSEAHNGSQVLFISPQKLSKLPPSVHGMLQPSSHTMKNIYFLYAKSNSELRGYLSTLHLRPLADKPSVIIVDDLNHYCSAVDGDTLNELVCFSKLICLIDEAASFHHRFHLCEKENGQTEKGQVVPWLVLMSWNTSTKGSLKTADLKEVARKNCQQVWTIKADNKKTIHKTFILDTENGERSLAVTFSLRNINPTSQTLYLEDILASRTEDVLSDDGQKVAKHLHNSPTADGL